MKITAENYLDNKPDRASLTDAEQAGYDFIEDGALAFYGQDATFTEVIDLYLAELNHKGAAVQEAAPAGRARKERPTAAQRKAAGKPAGVRRKGASFRLTAASSADMQHVALDCEVASEEVLHQGQYVTNEQCVVRAICNGQQLYFYVDANPENNSGHKGPFIEAVAAEGDDLQNPYPVKTNKLAAKRNELYGAQVLEFYRKAWRTHKKNEELVAGRAEHNRTTNATKKAAAAVSRHNAEPTRKAAASKPAAGAAFASFARFKTHVKVGQKLRLTNYFHPNRSRETVITNAQTNGFATADNDGGTGKAVWHYYTTAADFDAATGTFLITGRPYLKVEFISDYTPKSTPATEPTERARFEALGWRDQKLAAVRELGAERIAELLTGDVENIRALYNKFKDHPELRSTAEAATYGMLLKAKSGVYGEWPEFGIIKKKPTLAPNQRIAKDGQVVTRVAPAAPEPVAPKATGTRTKKKAAATPPKAKKPKPIDTRTPVAHFDNDVVFMKDFLRLEGKSVTLEEVRALHRRLEGRIVKHHVRAASPYAGDVADIAGLVAKTLHRMTGGAETITAIGTLHFNHPVVGRVRTHVNQLRIDAAITLLTRFINLQGSVPTEKQVESLVVALKNYYQEHPKGDHSLAIGAAAAVLEDWKPGRPIAVSQQQLGRLNGLGCPGTPAKPCGCSKKSAGLAGLPENANPTPPASPAEPYRGAPASAGAGVPEQQYQGWPEEAPADDDPLFTPIGVKDASRPAGERLALPGPLGKWLGGVIERHEWAMVLRGAKGAGKTRLQYQILNLFAGMGLNCALFTLEIDKNSNLVEDNTNAYIAPQNRARVKAASEAPGGMAAIEAAAQRFDVVAVDSWNKIPGYEPEDLDKMRKKYPRTLFVAIFQSTTAGTARGGVASEYDAAAVAQVDLPGVAHFEKNRYAKGPADELKWDVNAQKLIGG